MRSEPSTSTSHCSGDKWVFLTTVRQEPLLSDIWDLPNYNLSERISKGVSRGLAVLRRDRINLDGGVDSV